MSSSYGEVPDEYDDDVTSLVEQKLWASIHIIRATCLLSYTSDITLFNLLEIARLLVAVIPWQIDDESKEARSLEKELIDRCKYVTKCCIFRTAIEYWSDYLLRTICDASDPLDFDTFKQDMRKAFDTSSDSCCNIQ